MDNKKGKCCACPARMSSGSFISNYKSSRNVINKEVKQANKITNHNDYRKFLQQNATQIMAKESIFLDKNFSCNFAKKSISKVAKKIAKKTTPKKVTKKIIKKKVAKKPTKRVTSKRVTSKSVTPKKRKERFSKDLDFELESDSEGASNNRKRKVDKSGNAAARKAYKDAKQVTASVTPQKYTIAECRRIVVEEQKKAKEDAAKRKCIQLSKKIDDLNNQLKKLTKKKKKTSDDKKKIKEIPEEIKKLKKQKHNECKKKNEKKKKDKKKTR